MYYYNNVIIKIVTECVQNLKFWTVDFWTQLVFDSSTWASSCATRNDNQLGKARRRCATRVASLNDCANALRAYSELCCLYRVLYPMLCMVCAGSSRVGSPGTCQVETWQKPLRASQPRTTTERSCRPRVPLYIIPGKQNLSISCFNIINHGTYQY